MCSVHTAECDSALKSEATPTPATARPNSRTLCYVKEASRESAVPPDSIHTRRARGVTVIETGRGLGAPRARGGAWGLGVSWGQNIALTDENVPGV